MKQKKRQDSTNGRTKPQKTQQKAKSRNTNKNKNKQNSEEIYQIDVLKQIIKNKHTHNKKAITNNKLV